MIKLKTIFIFLVLLALGMPLTEVARGNDNIHSLKTINARLPMYNKDRLQFFIYSRELVRQGNKIDAKDAIIDLIRKGINVDHIKYMDKVEPYPLGAPAVQVLDFWKDKMHSEGIIMSPAAQIDQSSKTASGMEKVRFRSPMMDLDGVGFLANYDKRNVLIRKDVQIVIRMEAVEAAQKKDGKDSAGSSSGNVDVTSDTMFIDFENNIITLEGNVKVSESRFNIDCNKLILYMKSGAVEGLADRDLLKGAASKTSKNEPLQAEPKKEIVKNKKDDNAQALSKIICIGNVVITRKLSKEDLDKGAQVAKAGKAIYDMNTQQIVLTEGKPSIARGNDTITGKTITLWRETERMQVDKDALITMKIPKKAEEKAKPDALKPTEVYSDFMDIDYPGNLAVFTGNVKINDAMMDVDCHKMTIYLEDRTEGAKKAKPANLKSEQALTENVKAAKDVSEIICVGDVVVCRKAAAADGETAYADKAIYNLKESKIILSGNNPIIIRGKDSVSGQLVTIWVDQQRMKVDQNSRIVLESMKSGKMSGSDQSPSKGAAVVTSDYSDINYGGNEMSFDGKVRVKDPQMDLVCQKMKIYLEEKSGTVKKAPKAEDPMDQLKGGESQKDVSKIVCTGDVQADDPKMTLNCDTLTIMMADKKQITGKKKTKTEAVGPLGSDGKREISRLICEGRVKLESKEQKTDGKAKVAAINPNEGVQDVIKKGPAGKTVVSSDMADIRPVENYAELIGKVVVDEPRLNLSCKKMLIYADELKPEGQMKLSGDIDDEEKVSSDEVPRRISLGAGKELNKIICLDDVVILRKGGEKVEKATGTHGLYEVIDRKITLTGKPDKLPTLEQDNTVMEGEKFILYLNSEKVDAIGGKLKDAKMPSINNMPAKAAK
jgi:lipopolysaccharide export system protein LptA